MQDQRDSHWIGLKHTLNYVHTTCWQGIRLESTYQISLQAFSNSDSGPCIDTSWSITLYIILLRQSPISRKSKKQNTVLMSSSEAEYRAMSAAATEVSWFIRLLTELGKHNVKAITLHWQPICNLHCKEPRVPR